LDASPSRTILVAAGDPASLQAIAASAQPLGQVRLAPNGGAAVALARLALDQGQGYDVICIDLEMPGMAGRAILREIRKMETARNILAGRGSRIVMVTGGDDPKTALAVFREQADAIMKKPASATELDRLLAKAGARTHR
jgi:two-component system chemotaxis response regulator CheY